MKAAYFDDVELVLSLGIVVVVVVVAVGFLNTKVSDRLRRFTSEAIGSQTKKIIPAKNSGVKYFDQKSFLFRFR